MNNIKDFGPRVGVGVFVFRSHEDRRFLLGLRKGSHGAGTWSLPGGHIEFNETFDQCSRREIKEETNLDIEDVQFVTAVESYFEVEDKHYVTVFTTAMAEKAADGSDREPMLMEPNKCDGWQWVTFQQMREMNEKDGPSLFLPVRNLFTQRPAVCASMEGEAKKDMPNR